MKPRVLVVDDDPFYIEAATEVLTLDGRVEVIGSAADGCEALKRALSLQPDVVLMDIEMPLVDGIVATRRLRQALPSARVVLVSSSTTASGRRARESGAFASIAKSLAGDTLVQATLAALGVVAS